MPQPSPAPCKKPEPAQKNSRQTRELSVYSLLLRFGDQQNTVPWSSGQDASLSRWNQGFDSPRHYQMKTHRQVGFSVAGALLQGESDPKGQRRKRGSPADSRAAAGPSSRKRQRGCAGRRICAGRYANSPRHLNKCLYRFYHHFSFRPTSRVLQLW